MAGRRKPLLRRLPFPGESAVNPPPAVREHEDEWFQNRMQQALDLILVIDGDGTVVDASEGAQATFGSPTTRRSVQVSCGSCFPTTASASWRNWSRC